MLDQATRSKLDAGLKPLSQAMAQPETETVMLQRYSLFESELAQATAQGLILGLPSKADRQKVYDPERLHAIQDRLRNLGYLDPKLEFEPGGEISDALKQGILAFQSEADLVGDGWVGHNTWRALQQLVSFEEPTQIQRWLDPGGEPKVVLRRAIQLRLFSLGLSEFKPTRELSTDLSGLDRFRLILSEFGWLPAAVQLTPAELLEWLFDQDRLVAQLARSQPDPLHPNWVKARRFILSVAKIELWLLGKGTRPDGQMTDNYIRRRHRTRVEATIAIVDAQTNRLDDRSTLYKAIRNTWREMQPEISRRQLKRKTRDWLQFSKEFFARLTAMEEAGPEQIATSIEKQINGDRSRLVQLWGRAKSLVGKLFDGLRRIGRFFQRLLGRAKQALTALARPFYRLVADAYRSVKFSLRTITRGLTFFQSELLTVDNCRAAFARKSNDADLYLYVDRSDPGGVARFADRLLFSSRLLRIAARLLGLFLSLLKTVLKSSVQGWWGFFLAALKLHRMHGELIEILADAEELEYTEV